MSAPAFPLDPTAFAPALLLKATLLLAAAFGVTRVMAWRRASAASVHLVWTLAVLALLALPLLSAALPGWTLGIVRIGPPATASSIDGSLSPQTAAAPPIDRGTADGARLVSTDPSVSDAMAAMTEARRSVATDRASTASPAAARPIEPADASGIGLGTTLVGVYLLGVVVLLGRLAIGRWSVRRLARSAEPVTDEAWTELVRDVSWMLDVDRRVTVLRSRTAAMPMVWGVRRPTLLLPASADEWPEERRRVVLLHELAHVARHDCLTQTLAALATALYWPHPGAWYAERRLRVERELACDDRVLGAGTRAREYAAHLLEVARAFRPAAFTGAVAVSMARPSQLEGRLLAVLDGLRSRRAPSARARIAGIAAALLVAAPLASARPAAEACDCDSTPALGTLPAVSARAPGGAQEPEYERTIRTPDGGRLELRLGTASGVKVRGWDRDAVEVRAWTENGRSRTVRVSADEIRGGVRVTASGRVRGEHRIEIRVPRRYDVDVDGRAGGVAITEVRGRITGNTRGGPLALVQTAGRVDATTRGGPVVVADSRLEGVLRTEGGPAAVTGDLGELRVDTDGGPVSHPTDDGAVVTLSPPPPGRRAPDGPRAVGRMDAECDERGTRDRCVLRVGAVEMRSDGGHARITVDGKPVLEADDDGVHIDVDDATLDAFAESVTELVAVGERLDSLGAYFERHGADAAARAFTRAAFSDPAGLVQKAAIEGLRELPGREARDGLSRIARQHPREDIRRAAQQALRERGREPSER